MGVLTIRMSWACHPWVYHVDDSRNGDVKLTHAMGRVGAQPNKLTKQYDALRLE
jgi:hypothetical protein